MNEVLGTTRDRISAQEAGRESGSGELWIRWLLAVCAGVGAFGLGMVLLPGPIESFFNWMVFGDTATPAGFSEGATDYSRFIYGVLGAVLAGWMALIAAIVAGPLRRRERWAWLAVAGSFAGWFVIDTTHSLVTGYPENAAFNAVFAIAFVPPLIALRPR